MYSAALALGGMGLNSMVQRASRRYSPRPVVPTTPFDVERMKLEDLRRRVAKISPNIENVALAPAALSVPAATTQAFDYSITGSLMGNAEAGAKYIGDKFRNIGLLIRMNCHETLNFVRVIVYIPKVAGDGYTIPDLQSIPDETKYTLLYDTILFPTHSNQSRKNILVKYINLKNRLTTVDRTGPAAGTVRTCDVRIAVLAQNTSATTARTIEPWYKLRFQNK